MVLLLFCKHKLDGVCFKCGERFPSIVHSEIAEQEELAKKKSTLECAKCKSTHKPFLIILECNDVFCENCFKEYFSCSVLKRVKYIRIVQNAKVSDAPLKTVQCPICKIFAVRTSTGEILPGIEVPASAIPHITPVFSPQYAQANIMLQPPQLMNECESKFRMPPQQCMNNCYYDDCEDSFD